MLGFTNQLGGISVYLVDSVILLCNHLPRTLRAIS